VDAQIMRKREVNSATTVDDIELDLLLEAIYRQFHHDFRDYSRASLKRRLFAAKQKHGFSTTSELQGYVLHQPGAFAELLNFLTVQVSDMFRDPTTFRALREKVVPHLRTYPSLKVWVAGCSTGEELYSLAIIFREEELENRTIFYATDINPKALAQAEAGTYSIDRIAQFSDNYQRAGGRGSLADYYSAAYGDAIFDKSLRGRTVFSDHSLATDSSFAEAHLVSCRNVLIYFENPLLDRAIGLFRDSLVCKGFLALGAKEGIQRSSHSNSFEIIDSGNRIYRKKAKA
jgi:chemotaxis protein methyltransferase CheR